MATRLPASERTREELRALIDGRLGSSEARSALLRLATRLIVEEALEVEVEDALGRGYYEHGAVAGRVTPSGKTLVAQNGLRWEGVTMANKASFTPRRMEAAAGSPDAGQHGGDRSRAERPLGHAEGELRRRRPWPGPRPMPAPTS
jgi:hypothetical protein